MKRILLYIVILLYSVCTYSQHKSYFKEESLKGQVFAIERSEYNAENKFGEDTKTNLISRSVAYFDMTGNIIKEIRCHESLSQHFDTVFLYNNEMGKVFKVLQLEAKEKWLSNGYHSFKYYVYDTVMKEIYSYNENGNITDISTYKKEYSDELKLVSKIMYEYSANSYTEKKYSGSGALTESSTYTNNGKKKVTKEQYGTVTYTYDNNYRLVSENIQTDLFNMKDLIKYFYNPQGDMITMQSSFTSSKKNGSHTDNYTYTYDNNNNWIVRKYYSNNNNAKEKTIETWTERTITYIDDFESWQRLSDSIQTENLSEISYLKAKRQMDSITKADSLAKEKQKQKEEQARIEQERQHEKAIQQQQEQEINQLLSFAKGEKKKTQIKKCYSAKGNDIIFRIEGQDLTIYFDKEGVVKQTKDDMEYYLSKDKTAFVCKIKEDKKFEYYLVYNGHSTYSKAKGDTWDLSEKCYKQFEEFFTTEN